MLLSEKDLKRKIQMELNFFLAHDKQHYSDIIKELSKTLGIVSEEEWFNYFEEIVSPQKYMFNWALPMMCAHPNGYKFPEQVWMFVMRDEILRNNLKWLIKNAPVTERIKSYYNKYEILLSLE